MEAEGKFINLGREWIGSLVKYEKNFICHSKLFAQDDLYYTDQKGVNNDECEYFINAFVNDGKFFIQNFVNDFFFEIEFDFGKDYEKIYVNSKIIQLFKKNFISKYQFSEYLIL